MFLLAIDASTKASGVAIFDNNKLIDYNCIQCNQYDVLDRIKEMTEKIESFYIKYNPQIIVMEDVLPAQIGHNQSIYKALIYLQASIVMMFHRYNKKVKLVVASHWRKQCGIKTGTGITRDILKQKSINLVKGIYNIDATDDISDAICIGLAELKERA